MATSHIEWTDATWNPVTGCTKVSQGCKHCYAERMAKRLHAMGQKNYRNGFNVTCHEHMLDLPLRWRSPKRIFVNSMSDLFHPLVPVQFILKVFETMNDANWHQYQILTKRPERLLELEPSLDWAEHIWMGVSVEDERVVSRIDYLRQTRACVKFLSLEPLIGPLPSLNLDGIDWVIVGGESGPKARPMQKDWVRVIRDQCLSRGVPFFFKQWGGVQKSRTGRWLDGRLWSQYPARRISSCRRIRVIA